VIIVDCLSPNRLRFGDAFALLGSFLLCLPAVPRGKVLSR